MSHTTKLVILDRDGVINHDSDDFIKSPDEWIPIEGSLEAIARLNYEGFRVVVASNQSGIARGLFTIFDLNAIHQKMHTAAQEVGAKIDAIFFCPHTAQSSCACRKPKAGLFLDIAKRYEINLHKVPAIGDSLRDLEASAVVGCSPYLVLTGKGKKTYSKQGLPIDTQVYPDLSAAVDAFLNQKNAINSKA